jgi:hypothetical protein
MHAQKPTPFSGMACDVLAHLQIMTILKERRLPGSASCRLLPHFTAAFFHYLSFVSLGIYYFFWVCAILGERRRLSASPYTPTPQWLGPSFSFLHGPPVSAWSPMSPFGSFPRGFSNLPPSRMAQILFLNKNGVTVYARVIPHIHAVYTIYSRYQWLLAMFETHEKVSMLGIIRSELLKFHWSSQYY